MINLLKKLRINSNVMNLEQDLLNSRDCSIFGFNFGEKTWLVNSLKKPVLYVTTSSELADRLLSQFTSMGLKTKQTMFLPLDCTFNLYSKNEASENLVLALSELAKNELDVLIASPEILLKKLPLFQNAKNNGLTLTVGEQISTKTVLEKLNSLGYKRQEEIETKGDFTLKGDNLNIYNYENNVIYKIEFFDDEIEKIKVLSFADYSLLSNENNVSILPNNLFAGLNYDDILAKIDKELIIEKKKQSEENYQKLVSLKDQIALKLTLNDTSGIENILAPYLENYSTIYDYFKDGIVLFDETKQIVDYTKNLYIKHKENVKNHNERGEQFATNLNAFISEKDVYKSFCQKLSFGTITTQNNIFSPQAVYSFQSGATTRYLGNTDLLIQNLKHYDNSYYTTIICAENDNKANTLFDTLKNVGIASRVCPLNKVEKEQINIVPFGIDYGFCLPKEKIIVIGAKELARKQQVKTQSKKDVFFELPKSGDFVVHEKYGIGKCLGIEKLKFRGYNKDVIVLEYAKGDNVFLPTENIDMIAKYVGEGKDPKLNAIGSTEFLKTKQKVKESCKKLAINLMEIYSDRHKALGYKYEIDEALYKTFEDSFPYEETEDQLQAVEDCFNDMKNGRLMDRLVCGDVGFGKTEVAIRVIFATVMAGKQVAFLAPTTILSEQHYNSSFARLSSFGVRVAALNRFKTKKQVDAILKDLKEGKIDVVCGTHRLLSKDVVFKDLGLLVLDEEQRFGVGDKEKIKNIQRNINVLSLSATPIPRTLHMSLTGIRDISVIATPPKVRQPIQTFVMEESETVIAEAIERELTREGQVLIIYNRVETIYEVYKKIKDIVGEEVNVGVAHGQMTAKALEDEIMKLYSGETKILIATSLIENGVDLPNANTLIVLNADNFGLSQLYQFRGRVGRGNALAYAYLLYAPQKVLNETAYKRLNTLMEFTELGSGFKIATRDLEIRGAGNILGAEQHGHMAQIGYDMYCRLLNEAVEEMKGKATLQKQREVKMDIALDSFIPESFILSTDARIRVYNQLITISNEEERQQKLSEIEALYGNVPQEVVNLSLVTLLRAHCINNNISAVKVSRELSSVSFKKEDKESAVLLLNKLDKIKVKYTLSGALNIDVVINLNEESVINKVNKLIKLL